MDAIIHPPFSIGGDAKAGCNSNGIDLQGHEGPGRTVFEGLPHIWEGIHCSRDWSRLVLPSFFMALPMHDHRGSTAPVRGHFPVIGCYQPSRVVGLLLLSTS